MNRARYLALTSWYHNTAPKCSTALALVCATLAIVAPTEGHAATSNIPVSATILPPISLSEPAEMRFGTIASSSTAGNVTLSLPGTLAATPPTTASPTITGTRTRTGGVVLIGGGACSATVACGAGSVQVSGPISGTFSTVTLPATVTLLSGSDTLTVDNLNKRYGVPGTAGVTTGSGAFGAAGEAFVLMTGRLVVSASQPAGNYTGVMIITVDY